MWVANCDTLCRARVVKKAHSVMSDPGHLAPELFVMLPLGRRLRALKSGSKHTHDSFYPTAVHTMNDTFFHTFLNDTDYFSASLVLFYPTDLFRFHCVYLVDIQMTIKVHSITLQPTTGGGGPICIISGFTSIVCPLPPVEVNEIVWAPTSGQEWWWLSYWGPAYVNGSQNRLAQLPVIEVPALRRCWLSGVPLYVRACILRCAIAHMHHSAQWM